MDGIDVAICRVAGGGEPVLLEVLGARTVAWQEAMAERLRAAHAAHPLELARLNRAVGRRIRGRGGRAGGRTRRDAGPGRQPRPDGGARPWRDHPADRRGGRAGRAAGLPGGLRFPPERYRGRRLRRALGPDRRSLAAGPARCVGAGLEHWRDHQPHRPPAARGCGGTADRLRLRPRQHGPGRACPTPLERGGKLRPRRSAGRGRDGRRGPAGGAARSPGAGCGAAALVRAASSTVPPSATPSSRAGRPATSGRGATCSPR